MGWSVKRCGKLTAKHLGAELVFLQSRNLLRKPRFEVRGVDGLVEKSRVTVTTFSPLQTSGRDLLAHLENARSSVVVRRDLGPRVRK